MLVKNSGVFEIPNPAMSDLLLASFAAVARCKFPAASTTMMNVRWRAMRGGITGCIGG
ncbi:hypothetical protein WI664_19120 [Vibrio cholerae]